MRHDLAVIGAPSSAGAYAPGQEKAPAAFRRNGLLAALEQAGWRVRDMGDIAGFRWRPDPERPRAMNLDAVRATAEAVAERVARALSDDSAVLVLGGDCTIELGTVAGARRDGASVGLVYIDLDVDLNVPDTADGALDWTGVAHLLDVRGSLPELSGLGVDRPLLAPKNVLFFGGDIITPPELQTIDALGLERIALSDIESDPTGAAQRAAAWGMQFDRLLVHLDADILEYTKFPIAENVRRDHGLTLETLSLALGVLMRAPNWRALTVTEVNPDHAPDESEALRKLIAALASALSV